LTMNTDSKKSPKRNSRMRGFTIVELVIVLAVIMIVTAISVPSFLRIIRIYRLNDAATQVAGIMKFTRYEAIRRNVGPGLGVGGALRTQILQGAAGTNIFTDSNYSGTVQSTETQILLTGNVNLVSAATPPNTAGLAAAVGVAALTNVSITNGTVAFDQRGAVTPAAVNVLYIGNPAVPNLGYRAVVLLPSGSVQIWATDSSGIWSQLN
jgi:type IV fimbrial biogenesis protein FimT